MTFRELREIPSLSDGLRSDVMTVQQQLSEIRSLRNRIRNEDRGVMAYDIETYSGRYQSMPLWKRHVNPLSSEMISPNQGPKREASVTEEEPESKRVRRG